MGLNVVPSVGFELTVYALQVRCITVMLTRLRVYLVNNKQHLIEPHFAVGFLVNDGIVSYDKTTNPWLSTICIIPFILIISPTDIDVCPVPELSITSRASPFGDHVSPCINP